ncbi:MAG: hypothetical protein AAFW98_19430, partial [Pseudomonadota bacterium]
KKNVLVLYYSRTGYTETVARDLAQQIGADIEDIKPAFARGIFFDALRAAIGKRGAAKPLVHDVGQYDLVLIGTPIWLGGLVPDVRAALYDIRSQMPAYAAFATSGAGPPQKGFSAMEAVLGKAPVATVSIKDKVVQTDDGRAVVAAFAQRIKGFVMERKKEALEAL